MSIFTTSKDHPLYHGKFPRSSRYDLEWIFTHQMGPNMLWLTEWLTRSMDLKPGMRVLDMGCGKALSSIFLALEYDVTVWANDLWISPTENWQRIREAGLENQVFPVQAEAHALPYAEDFFDAMVSLDAYQYFGTDDLYLGYIGKLVRPGGQIGIVVPGLARDFGTQVPEHLTRMQKSGIPFWVDECWCFHTAEWWRGFWGRYSLVDVETTDVMPDGVQHWLQYEKACEEAGTLMFSSEAEALEADAGRYLALIRAIARKK